MESERSDKMRYTEDNLSNLKIIFDKCDLDNDGFVSLDVISSLMATCMDPDRLSNILSGHDLGSDLSFDDFVKLFNNTRQDDHSKSEILTSSMLNTSNKFSGNDLEEKEILQNRVERLQSRLTTVISDRDNLFDQIANLEEENKSFKTQVKTLQEKNNRSNQLAVEIEAYKSELAASSSREVDLQKKVVKLTRDLKQKSESNDDELSNLKIENSQLRVQINIKAEENLLLEENKSNYLQDFSKNQILVKELEEIILVQKSKFINLQHENEVEKKQYEEKIMVLQNRAQNLESELQTLSENYGNQSLKGGTLFDEIQQIGRKSPPKSLSRHQSSIYLNQDRELQELREQLNLSSQNESEYKHKFEAQRRENVILTKEMQEKEMLFEENKYMLRKQQEEEISKIIYLYQKRCEIEKSLNSQETNNSEIRDKLLELKNKLITSDISKGQIIRRKHLNARIHMLTEQLKLREISHETKNISFAYQEYRRAETIKSTQKNGAVMIIFICILMSIFVHYVVNKV